MHSTSHDEINIYAWFFLHINRRLREFKIATTNTVRTISVSLQTAATSIPNAKYR